MRAGERAIAMALLAIEATMRHDDVNASEYRSEAASLVYASTCLDDEEDEDDFPF